MPTARETANKGAGGDDLWCRWCQRPGHNIQDCWTARCTYEQATQSRQVSFSSDAYHQAYAVNTADAKLSLESSAAHASTDLADTLAGIGTPLPCNAMPDPAAFNTDVAVDPTELQALLIKYKDCFPSELPAKLPPERNVYHTVPLKNNDPPPPRKSYRLGKPEVAELNSQVASLLEKGYIQARNSPYIWSSSVVCEKEEW